MNRPPASPMLFCLSLALASCAAPAPPPPSIPAQEPLPEEAPVREFLHQLVWTASEKVELRTEYGTAIIAHPFTRFDVLEADSTELRVRCSRCPHPLEGWIREDAVVFEPGSPSLSAAGSLAEFALAVRQAAIQRDFAGLHPVMYEHFTFSFGGGGGPADAFHRWRFESFRTLDQLPVLLDGGLASPDGTIWTAPPEFATSEDYTGLRAGFRRVGDRWQWIYLVRGD